MSYLFERYPLFHIQKSVKPTHFYNIAFDFQDGGIQLRLTFFYYARDLCPLFDDYHSVILCFLFVCSSSEDEPDEAERLDDLSFFRSRSGLRECFLLKLELL
eukprot:UN29467